jgi:signal transduction histidine kinase
VTVSAELVHESYVQVSVSDTGMGIPQDEYGKVFERFYRSRKAVDAQIQGTGLGLAVAKKMVEQWGGAISFVSEEGHGTTFTFTIPITKIS